MKKDEIIRINLYCSKFQNEETINFWKNDRKEYKYKNFPLNRNYEYIEENSPEVIFILIKNTKNFLYYYIRRNMELNIQNNYNSKNDETKDFIYFCDEITYKISYFFQIIDFRTGLPANIFIRVTLLIETIPSCWISGIIFEMIDFKDRQKNFIDSINKIETIYDSDLNNKISTNNDKELEYNTSSSKEKKRRKRSNLKIEFKNSLDKIMA